MKQSAQADGSGRTGAADFKAALRLRRRRRAARWLNAAAVSTGLCAWSRARQRPDWLPVLCYHRVHDSRRPLCTPPDAFARHMRHLRARHHPMPLSDLARALANRDPWPRRAVVVTFDDGYRDALDTALPILERYAIPAVVFVTTRLVDREEWPWWEALADLAAKYPGREWSVELDGRRRTYPMHDAVLREYAFRDVARRLAGENAQTAAQRAAAICRNARVECRPEACSRKLLSWQDLRRLRDAGVAIGCHGLSHGAFAAGAAARTALDLARARDRIQVELGEARPPLAIPFGMPEPPAEHTRRMFRNLGFACAVTHAAAPRDRVSDPFAIPRTGVESETFPHFACKVAGLNRMARRFFTLET